MTPMGRGDRSGGMDDGPSYYARELQRLRASLYGSEDLTARIVRAKRYIDRHYAEGIDLDAICAQACFSKYHFIRQFRRYYGRTPKQYLAEVRVARAKELIRGGMTVRGACFAVCYESMTSFATLFRRMTGAAPSRLGQKSNSR